MSEPLITRLDGYCKALSVRVDTDTSRVIVDRKSLALLIEEH